MYVTRRLSEYQKNPSELRQPPPEGPNSGVLVIQDEESRPTCCFGSCYESGLKGLPFPQNAKLAVNYTIVVNNTPITYRDPVLFIPVLDQPLSANRYYVINRSGKHSGESSASAKEEDRTPCCFCFSYIPEAKPQEPDPYDIYQQFEIHQKKSVSRYYYATSVAPDGIPPEFLKRKNWTVEYSTSEDFGLTDDAKGLNTRLRAQLPNDVNSRVVVGQWYVPFIFVKEKDAKDQIKNSAYYSMILHQKWEEVYICGNDGDENREVVVNVEVKREVVRLEGKEIENETRSVDSDGVLWFEVAEKRIGLSSVVMERVKWEEERFGWRSDPVRDGAVVKRCERFSGNGADWKTYKCYVLVETFVLERSDGSVALAYEFRHVDKLKSKFSSSPTIF